MYAWRGHGPPEEARALEAEARVQRLEGLIGQMRASLGLLLSPAQSTVEGVAEVAERCRRAEAECAHLRGERDAARAERDQLQSLLGTQVAQMVQRVARLERLEDGGDSPPRQEALDTPARLR